MELFVQSFVNGCIAAALYALVALGFNLMFSTGRFFNIALGASIPIGGYSVFFLSKIAALPLALSVPAAIVIAGAFGALLDAAIFAPMRAKRASSLVLIIASLGAYTVTEALLAISFSSQLQTLSSLAPSAVYRIGVVAISAVQLGVIMAALGTYVGVWVLRSHTRFGRAVRAVSDDPDVAAVVGIHTTAIIRKTFFLASAIGGLVGVLVGLDVGIEPAMGMFYFLSGVIGSIVGTIGNVWGGLAGSMLEGVVENLGIIPIGGEWKQAIAFVILIVFLVFRPQGIMKS